MRLSVKNIGKVEAAAISIDGITVIAGENNTGKSTIGKTLYCLFNAFCRADEKIAEQRHNSLTNAFRTIVRKSNEQTPLVRLYRVSRQAAMLVMGMEQDTEGIIQALLTMLREQEYKINVIEADLKEFAKKAQEIMAVSDEEIQRIIIKRYFDSEFEEQVQHVDSLLPSEASLQIKEKKLYVSVDQSACDFQRNIEIITNAIYIDTPFVLDDLGGNGNTIKHRNFLNELLTHEGRHAYEDVFEEAISRQKLERVMEKIRRVADGEFVGGGENAYREASLSNPIFLTNLSTGLKTFVILKRLLENGSIEENGVLILDEPEIHLHPQWQIIFAELLVLLQQQFGLHILLNTHSPYFLHAIEVFSEKHGLIKKCHYYLAEVPEQKAVFTEVIGQTERIYQKLAEPLQILEDIRYGENRDD